MMKRTTYLLLLALLFFMAGCRDDFGERSVDPGDFQPGSGVFILNEGNFGQGNGSLTYYSYDDTSVTHDVFRTVNDRPLGDLPVSMSIIGEQVLIAVNHSGRVEAASSADLHARYTLSGLASPRQFVLTGTDEVAVSDLQSPELRFFDLASGTLTGTTDINRSSEAMICSGNRLFVANWSSYYVPGDNRYVMVVDTDNKQVIDSVLTGKEPQSMVRDYQGRIWVLCSGGFDGSEYPVLLCFDPLSLQVLHWLDFPSKDRSPSDLCVNGTLDTLFYLDRGLYRIPVNAPALPLKAFIAEGSNSFYALGIDPVRGDIFLSDALDYQQNGYIWRYNKEGELVHRFRAGIIPGEFCFE